MSAKPVEERFWKYVEFSDNCWLWKGPDHKGYGRFSINYRYKEFAHRLAYKLIKGQIPEGLVIDHLCRTPLCVNPLHMEPVTIRENTLRGNTIQARNLAKTHCKRGHPLTEANVQLVQRKRNGGVFTERHCRPCGAEAMRQIRARRISS